MGAGGAAGAGHTGAGAGGHINGASAGAGFTGGADSQPARTMQAAHRAAAMDDNGVMGWVFLEIFGALAAALAIVWWTFPKGTESDDDKGER